MPNGRVGLILKIYSKIISLTASLLMLQNSRYILIAEDDEDDQLLLVSAFNEIGQNMELVFVENGIELVNHFRKFEEGSIDALPALLIVDLNMPKKNGREAIRELVSRHYFRNFPTIIFSTTGNEMERTRCRELGINDFFVKPSNFHLLKEIVSRFTQMAEPST
jgi:CheY-like chemotaxis protein